MVGSESLKKIMWTKKMVHFFYICIKAIEMRMRLNTHFDKTSWKFLVTAFKE
jgi:hypothetical protein